MIRETGEELPIGWAETVFGELNTYRGKNLDPADYPSEIFELYSVPNFPKGIPEYQPGEAIGSTKQTVEPNDVLVCKINPRINRVWKVANIKDKRQIGSSEWIVFRAPEVSAEFFKHYFKSNKFREQLCEDVTGVGGSLTRAQPSKVATFEIPLPPLAEQIRIADKLDAILSRVEAGRTRLERVPKLMKRFRQSVLSAAVSGELTREWRGGGDADWEETELGPLIKFGPKNGLYKHSSAYGSGTKILRIGDFYEGEISNLDDLKSLEISDVEKEEYSLSINDIIINRVNSFDYLGKTALVRNLKETVVFESNMMRIRFDTNRILPSFCVKYLCSEYGKTEIRRNAKHAVNQASINQTDVKGCRIQLPPLAEQTEIVRHVEALFAIADRLEARAQAALTSYTRLTPALLAKAFRGELVEQDPNDEPASVLLERISSQRETAVSAKKASGGRGRKLKAAQASAEPSDGQPKRRGRPPKASTGSTPIPEVDSFEEAVRRLEEQKRQRAQMAPVNAEARLGTVQAKLFEE